MSHILLRLNGSNLAQFPDTDLTITRNNPYFNDGSEVESYPFSVPLEGNRQHFQNAEVIESDATIHPVRGGIMEVIVDGVPIISGKCGSIEDQELIDRVSLKLESAVHTLDDYLDGVRCRDVQVKDDILIGETIGDLSAVVECNVNLFLQERLEGSIDGEGGYIDEHQDRLLFSDKVEPIERQITVPLPALGFSRSGICTTRIRAGAEYDLVNRFDSFGSVGKDPDSQYIHSCINVSRPYPEAKFCNSRISYLHYKIDDSDEKHKKSSDEVDTRTYIIDEYCRYNPYLVLEADRPASGICFYVLYFLDCLFNSIKDGLGFKNDGIYYDNSELLKVDDLRRLVFYTSHCKYDIRQQVDPQAGPVRLTSTEMVNNWLHTRNINTTLSIGTDTTTQKLDYITIDDKVYKIGDMSPFAFEQEDSPWPYNTHGYISEIRYEIGKVTVSDISANVFNMYANAMNFPDADAKEIIDSLWGAFGIKFYLDPDTRIVKARFIRDLFRDSSAPLVFPCEVINAVRQTENITGFRMMYSGTSDEQQRKDNITLGIRDYDTTYDYQDYSNIDLQLRYNDILGKVYDSNMTCYIDLMTGNRYRIKIDGDAEDAVSQDFAKRKDLHPVLFEVGQLSCVEIGDCSKENADFVFEITNSFQPVVFNDVYYREQSKTMSATIFTMNDSQTGLTHGIRLGTDGPKKQILAPFFPEDMWHENIARRIIYPIGLEHISFKITADITTVEAFDPSSSDDGDSPLQHADWGLAVAIMRGGGSESHLDYYDYDYDGFGNCKFRTVAGTDYGMSLDSIDCYSQVYDYNGDTPGIDGGPDDYHGAYDTRYDGTYTQAEAAAKIAEIWPDSNADLLTPPRKVTGAAALSAGWEEARGADFCTVLSRTYCLTDYDGQKREFLVTPITDRGYIYTPAQVLSYLSWLEILASSRHQSIMSLDALSAQDEDEIGVGFHLIIQQFSDVTEANDYHSPWSDFYSSILHQFHAIYYGDAAQGEVRSPRPYLSERFSLKIRSYIPAPYDIIGPDGQLIKAGEPLCASDPSIRNRGLFDTFFSEYAHWLLNRKKVKLTILCEVSALTNIQWHRRYRFGDYVGFINSFTAKISAANGLEQVDVELFI